ncbi:MAG TPA: peroxide stress protein YaaA [Noviherbaspirillum sp.]|jgi:hypothetical protein|uniref:peroxide stress protein YaaA n=1 Tax=Noviherbaspirillum sp. TaxID=1926288 RepID=UPI002DDD1B1A|nr:peroxide stress protein YaaA [Noviherbaspirillum sp.]HEV2611412.1 peroxide stress protein YaaA [Noviherbaspirillum sp.]
MLIVLSPAKTLDYVTPPATDLHTRPDFIEHSAQLIDILKKKAPAEIASLMGISDALAALNADRFAAWSKRRFTTASAKQALFAFNGDVYDGLDATSLSARQIDYAQSHLRILSGLYGVLRPLDLMQPYRLEMGTRLDNPRGKDLYAFWGDLVTTALNAELEQQPSQILVNLASDEYFKSVKPKLLNARIVTPVFEDWKNGKYKIISFFAKRARGLMARYAITKGLRQVEKLKAFDSDGYAFDAAVSTENTWVFRRRS